MATVRDIDIKINNCSMVVNFIIMAIVMFCKDSLYLIMDYFRVEFIMELLVNFIMNYVLS